MPYDEELAERVRGHLGDREVVEKRMFGGLAFLVGGHMAVATSGRGVLMVRCEPAESGALLERPGAHERARRTAEAFSWPRSADHMLAVHEQVRQAAAG